MSHLGSRLRTAFVLFSAFGAGFVAHAAIGTANAKPAAESPYSAMGQLGRVLALVENEFVDPTDRTKLVDGAIEGMVDNLDPHSTYYTAREFHEMQDDTAGKFVGIGVEVEFRNDMIAILAVLENSPAEKAGLKAGDAIIEVDGQGVKQVGFEKLVRQMRGVAGTHVKLVVARPKHVAPMFLDIVRAEVHQVSVKAAMMPNDVAYILIRQYQEGTHEELLRAVAKLRGEDGKVKISGVLFDQRGNPGGLVDQATGVADEFLTGGTIYTMRHRGQITETATAHGGGALASLPVVILMSSMSASASELVAGALQDSDDATVVGTRSWGKGVVQEVIDLPNGAGLKITTSRYYTPHGNGVQGEGIHPDVLVETTEEADGGAHEMHFPRKRLSEFASERRRHRPRCGRHDHVRRSRRRNCRITHRARDPRRSAYEHGRRHEDRIRNAPSEDEEVTSGYSPSTRFSSRVGDYVKYRPRYPDAAIDAIVTISKIARDASSIADIGSGTGISARPFLERGFRVLGVEPNAEMRRAAEDDLRAFPNFESIDGTAEKMGIRDASIDLTIAAQAFHWFRSGDARAEIVRVSKTPHVCALVWNERLTDTDFLRAYEKTLMEHAIDYAKVDHRNVDRDRIAEFFRGPFETMTFPNAQRFDRDGLVGRALSSSYVPQKGHEKFDETMTALARIFSEHAKDGFVEFRYTTMVHIGKLAA